eukprot:9499328-Pyramimonas_sp.AAC.1
MADCLSNDEKKRPPTAHNLVRPRRGRGWRCRCCNEAVSESTALINLREWFAEQCGGPPRETGTGV